MKKHKKIVLINLFLIIFILIIIALKLGTTVNKNYNIDEIDMLDNENLVLKNGSNIKLNISFSDNFKVSINRVYKWSSSDNDVCSVDDEGIIYTKEPGTAYIEAKHGNDIIKTKVTVYDTKNVLIIVGDSRMDHFKDDNGFTSTSDYEVKYTEKPSLLSDFERIYVVSLSGMRYNWLAGENGYQDNNATLYVEDIIEEYEDKTTDIYKYNIKILFNLGVNDLNHKYLGDDSPAYISGKYIDKLEEIMNNEWKSDIINNISLNMVTLLPVEDEQVSCYFTGRYNSDVIEFNEFTKKEYDGVVCDAYNDLDINENSFRERTDKECANRDGLHFSKEFNREVLYPYLVNVCAKK